MKPTRKQVKEWLWRYGPAEIVSLVTTLVASLAVYHATNNKTAMAVAGTWGGNVGYFGTILCTDIIVTSRLLRSNNKAYTFHSFLKNIRALFIEFGLAEFFDTLLIRPLLLYYMPQVTGNLTFGLIAAKFIADITFYLPAILFYEWSKKRYRNY